MKPEYQTIYNELSACVRYLAEHGRLKTGASIVLGCSTSEVAGGKIGHNSVPELGGVLAFRRRRFRQPAGGRGHLRLLPRIRLPRGAAVRLGQGEPQDALLLDPHGLPGRALQRGVDRGRQLLDADADRLQARGRRHPPSRRDHRFPLARSEAYLGNVATSGRNADA